MNLDPKKVEREIADAIKGAPPDVNPLLDSFVVFCISGSRFFAIPACGKETLEDDPGA